MQLTQGQPPLTTAVSVTFSLFKEVHLFSRRTSLWPHQTRDVSDARSNFNSAPGARETCAETVLCSQRKLFNCTHKGAGTHYSLCPFISKRKIKYVHAMSWSIKSWRYQKVIKAAVKLCVHVICYILVTFKKRLWNGFQNCPGQSPSSNTTDSSRQLVSSDFKTWSGSEMVKKVERKYDACQIGSS